MAEEKKELNKKNDEKKTFKVQIDEHYDFDAIASSKYITSQELCKMVSDLLKCVFADFEGCKFEVNQGMEPTIALYFNHNDHTGSDLPCACEKNGAAKVGNTIIDRGRARDMFNRNGDKYYLTDEGKEFVKGLLARRYFNNGNPDFGRIVGEEQERGAINNSFIPQYTIYTKVAFISISRICSLLFGNGEEENDRVEYEVNVSSPLPSGYGVSNFVLNVTRISSKELSNFCNKIGISQQQLNIVR